MIARELLQTLEHVYGLASRSFLNYLVEAARPFTQDDWDRQALGALEAWHRETRSSLEAMVRLLEREKVHPVLPLWPLSFSQYNMVRPTYLLRPLLGRMETHLAAIREVAKAFSRWAEAREVLEGLVERNETHLQKVKDLEERIPREPPRPAVKKGVSANFW